MSGFVVRGKRFDTGAATWLAYEPTGEHVIVPRQAQRTTFASLASAIQAWCDGQVMCTDVTIYRVADDGTEAPLPTYEDALAGLGQLRKIAGAAIERGCEAAAAHIETTRGDGVSFWKGADDEQRAATREMVEYLLAGESVARWVNPASGEALREVVMRAAWGEDTWAAAPIPDVRDTSMARIAKLTGEAKHEAMRRASRSYSAPGGAIRHEGCRVDGAEPVWPDGERWPIGPEALARLTGKEQL